MKVLIVEDDSSVASHILQMIKEWGHQVELSVTGKEALRQVTRGMFDLVLLDIFLPDIEGYELIPQFKKLRPEMGIITMTGHNSRDLELRVRREGILYYMIKPFEIKHLKILLDHISKRRDQNIERREVKRL